MNKYMKVVVPVMLGVMGMQLGMGEEAALGNKEKEKGKETVSSPANRMLVIQLDPQNEIVLSVPSITSISKHSFLLNGTMLVYEVTIDTTGNNSVRFYCVQEDDGDKILVAETPQDAVQQAAGRINKEMRNGKGKKSDETAVPSLKYPEGVYAHTIEFQVHDPAILLKLYRESNAVWESGAPKVVRVRLGQNKKNDTPSQVSQEE